MSKVKIKLNYAGVGALLKSDEMTAHLRTIAQGVQSRAGDGYVVTTYKGKTRANASVYAESAQARRDNLQNNTLLRALQ